MGAMSKLTIEEVAATSMDIQELNIASTVGAERQAALKEVVASHEEHGTFYDLFGLPPLCEIDDELRDAIDALYEAACDRAQRLHAPSPASVSTADADTDDELELLTASSACSTACSTPSRRPQADLCALAVARQVLQQPDLKRRYDIELLRLKDQDLGNKEWYCFQIGHWLLFFTGVTTVVVGTVATSGAGMLVLTLAGSAALTAAINGRMLLDYDPDCSMLEYGKHLVVGSLVGVAGCFITSTIGLAPLTAPFVQQYFQAVATGASLQGSMMVLSDISDLLCSSGSLGQAMKDNVCSVHTADKIFTLANLGYFLTSCFAGPLFAHMVPVPGNQQACEDRKEVEETGAMFDVIDSLCICGTCPPGQLGNCEEVCLKRSQSSRLALCSPRCSSPHSASAAGSDAWSVIMWPLGCASHLVELVAAGTSAVLRQEEKQSS